MNFDRTGASGTTIGIAVVVIVVVVAGGAYLAFGTGGSGSSTTTTTTTSTTTSASTGIQAATLNAGGGTLVYPLMQDWITAYNFVQPKIEITYNALGSGQGIHGITTGLYNFGESDAPLTASQYAALPSGSSLLTVPISDSGIIPAYNIPGITAHLNFTGNVLAEIFFGAKGGITMWNDPRIAALQSPSVSAQLPAHAIQVYH